MGNAPCHVGQWAVQWGPGPRTRLDPCSPEETGGMGWALEESSLEYRGGSMAVLGLTGRHGQGRNGSSKSGAQKGPGRGPWGAGGWARAEGGRMDFHTGSSGRRS